MRRGGPPSGLDERIVRFAQDYLPVREPDSPYQKDRFVTDPVCGMRLRRADAAAGAAHGGAAVGP